MIRFGRNCSETTVPMGFSIVDNFDLGREPTRVEALVMLVRALGEEQTALDGTWSHPFRDVPSWADAYVGYAYQNGLTNGVSADEFGTDNASAAMYVTFMLRALGYSDADGDFAWNDPFGLGRTVGIVTEDVDLSRFLRADVVEVSYAALDAKVKGGDITLADRLIKAGVIPGSSWNREEDGKTGIPDIFVRDPVVYEIPVQPKDPVLTESYEEPAIGD